MNWDEPPASVGAAIEAYREVAERRPWVLLVASAWALLAAAVGGAGAMLVFGPLAGVGAGIIAFLSVLALARLVASTRYRFGSVLVQRVGEEAFVREYARSRGLRLENRWAFHSEMRSFPMPGVADHVLAGRLPGTGVEGRFVMFADAAEMRSRGQELALTTDRPLAANAILVRLRDELSEATAEAVAALPDHYRMEISGRDLLVWRPIQGSLIRTAEGSDNFCAKANGVATRIAGSSNEEESEDGQQRNHRPNG